MINQSILNPKSIVVVGASNDIKKPGGKLLKNILNGIFSNPLYVVNPNEEKVQGINCFNTVNQLPKVDLAILAIPARKCLDVIRVLLKEKNTKGFIIISAGFGEANEEGALLEKQISNEIEQAGACLIGPNCIGVLTPYYNGVFTSPIPELSQKGCDLISASGATAVFIMEAGMPLGLKFNNVISVGNGAQTRVEDVIEYMDIHYDPEKDSNIKLLYLETIQHPEKLIKHTQSLIQKGVKIAAIKSGVTEAGSRAAASHTGAIASSDKIIRALFKKAGIVYCSSREELISVASIFNYKELKGKNIAIITHAGGSAVMLTDVLSENGLNVPKIDGKDADSLLSYLNDGSSVSNPIDFLATGTAEQLGIIIDYCEHKFSNIDAMVVVFGSPGLFDVENVYNVLSVKLSVCKKPIYPVLPSVVNAQKEIKGFLAKENINFPDEVVLGRALAAVYNTEKPSFEELTNATAIDNRKIRTIIDSSSEGFLSEEKVISILEAANIPHVKNILLKDEKDLNNLLKNVSYPIVMKVSGLIHKTDEGGVVLNVNSAKEAEQHFKHLIKIKGANGVTVQQMISGMELFVGIVKEPGFNHAIVCGLGGIYVEIINDFSTRLLPLSKGEAKKMIQRLRAYPILKGYRGKEGINEEKFIYIIEQLSKLVNIAPEITEMDINPIIGLSDNLQAVDVRIRIEKLS